MKILEDYKMIPIIISVLVICIIIYIDSRKISKLEDALRG